MPHDTERRVYEALDGLGIEYTRYEHPPVFTVEQAEQHWAAIPATHCKNLFLRNKKGNVHYLLIAPHLKRIDLRAVAAAVRDDRLSFASEERLAQHLGLSAGSVSPFGLINDESRAVRVAVDRELKAAQAIAFHPNVNTATIVLSFVDFERFVVSTGHEIEYVTL